jgi:hypothetical protein
MYVSNCAEAKTRVNGNSQQSFRAIPQAERAKALADQSANRIWAKFATFSEAVAKGHSGTAL